MIGFKAFKPDMTCLGFQYTVGGTFTIPVNETIKICQNGFHFCRVPKHVFKFYKEETGPHVYGIVRAEGQIAHRDTKSVCSKITILKLIPVDKFKNMIVKTKDDGSLHIIYSNGHEEFYQDGKKIDIPFLL